MWRYEIIRCNRHGMEVYEGRLYWEDQLTYQVRCLSREIAITAVMREYQQKRMQLKGAN